MKKILTLLFVVLCIYPLSTSAEEEHPVLVLELKGTVDPALARYVARGLEEGRRAEAAAVVLDLGTSGGLEGSLQRISQIIQDSPVPVVAYLSGGGSPQIRESMFPDTDARIAESAQIVLPASDVKDLGELLRQDVEGRPVKTIFGMTTLSVKDQPLRPVPLSLMENVLHRLAHPNLAYLLLLLGIYGLVYALAKPGAVFPGVLAANLLVLALIALETLEVHWGGITLITLAILLFIAGIRFPRARNGAAAAGVLLFALGSALLFPGGRIPSLRLHWSAIGSATLLTAGFFMAVVGGRKR